MKIAVTITTCRQIGPETWKDYKSTKIFKETSTIKEIDAWIKSIDNCSSFSDVIISLCVD